jgi:zinc protease
VRQALIKIDIIYKAGKWYEPSVGISHFSAQLIEKGTQKKDSSQIAETFDQYGAHIEIAPGYDYTTVSLYCLSNKLKDVFPLFIEILLTPSFPESELELSKNIFAQNLKINNEKNSYVASKLIRRNIFGSSHPYGSSVEEKKLVGISREEIIRFFKGHFSPYEIYLTGQIDNSSLKYISQELKQLDSATGANKVAIQPLLTIGEKEEYLEKKGSIQTSLRLGKRTINRNHKDYFDLLLLNHILGGYFGSRLMKNIREEKGLTYGINSSINTFLHDSLFVIGADVNKKNQEITIQEVRNELKSLREQKISSPELEIAKSHFLGSIQLDMANPFSVMEKIKNINLNHLDTNYYNELFNRINRLTSNDLIEISKIYLTDEDLTIVKVG